MPSPKAGQAGQLLIFLNQRFGLPGYFLRWNLDLNLALGSTFFDFRGAHNRLSINVRLAAESRLPLRSRANCRKLECKDSPTTTSNARRRGRGH
jgi:hypothetical protein